MPLSKEQHDELCVSYASLILFDGEAEITSDALMSVITASGNEVEPYWPTLFAGFLSKEGRIMDLITSGGPSSGAGGAASSGNATSAEEDAGAAKDEPKEEEADMVHVTFAQLHFCLILISFCEGSWRRNGHVWRR